MYLGRSPSSWDFTWGVEVCFAPSRSLTIVNLVNRKLQRKSAPEAARFRPRPLRSREKGDSYRRSPFLFLDSRFRRPLGLLRRRVYFFSSFPDPKVLVSFELSDWWRWLVKLSLRAYYQESDIMSYYMCISFIYIYFLKRKNYSLSTFIGFRENNRYCRL